jgi:two-component system, chemotaxis family, chemotaxis protein CheY
VDFPTSVLIIDDEASVRQSLVDVFTTSGSSHVREASSAEEAFLILQEEPFSLIICDHRLPGITGLAFMGKLRLQQDMTPILIISGVPNKDEIKHAASQLKAAFLAKPFTTTELRARIEELLG